MKIDEYKNYKLGIKTIDDDHKELFTLCNNIYNSTLTNEEVKTMLLNYYDLLFNHFLNEENYMEDVNFPYIDHHRESHRHILEKVFNAVDNSKTCEIDNRKNVMKIIDDTLVYHIENYDFKIRDFVNPEFDKK